MEIIDTDVLIDVQRGHAPALAWFASLTDLPVIPGYAVMELIQDARNSAEVRNALGRSATLYTFNDKHYRMVPGLTTVRPYVR